MKRGFASLRRKLLQAVLPLIIVPLVLSIAVTYTMTVNRQQAQSRSFMSNILEQVSGNLDRYMRDLNVLSMMPLAEESILDILRNRVNSGPRFITMEERLAVSRFHAALMYERSEIQGYLLFALDGTLLASTEHDVKSAWRLQEEGWMEAARKAEGRLVFLPRNIPAYYTSTSEAVLSVTRMILDPSSFKEIGFVKIDLNYDGFRKILYPQDNQLTRFFVYTNTNEMIYPNTLEREAFLPKGNLLEIDGTDYLASSITSSYSGITVYLLYSNDVLQKDARDIQRVMVSISLGFLLLSIVVCVGFASHLTKPLRALRKDMLAFGKGDLSLRTQSQSNDEIGILSSGFNDMAQRIQTLVRENYQIQLNRWEAEVLLLQSQMNPHFLYNTLETISMSAMNHDDLETSDIVARLGKMLRYSVSVQKELVKLRAEVQFCEDYLQLQALRLGGKLQYEINLAAELEDCLVPKLILQPFVENVVMHALGQEPVHVWIVALVQWDRLLLLIKDNGVGMTGEQCRLIQERMYAEETPWQGSPEGLSQGGIALRNVHQRIQLLYGSDYGVSILSSRPGETLFLVSLPLLWTEGDE